MKLSVITLDGTHVGLDVARGGKGLFEMHKLVGGVDGSEHYGHAGLIGDVQEARAPLADARAGALGRDGYAEALGGVKLVYDGLAERRPASARHRDAPMALKRYFMGKKNHASFIRKPALRPSDHQANLPSTKSQLDVCGAT